MEIEIILPKAHSESQNKIFQTFVTPNLLEAFVSCGTKYGKTLAASEALAISLPIKKQGLFRWVAPIYSQARIGMHYLTRMLPPEPWIESNKYGIYVPQTDSRLEFKSGHDPENLEGEACSGYVLDECSKLKEQVYSSARTTVTLTRGPILAISTPRGRNWFYKKCMAAKEEMDWATAKGIPPKRIFITAPTADNPFVPREAIEDARKTLPERLFRQYYLAEFVEDGSVFTNVHNCYCTDAMDMSDQFLWTAEGSSDESVCIGVDWARNVDFTVFTAVNPKTRRIVGMWRMQGLGYPAQVQRLKIFASKFKSCETIWHDKTGVGVALDDMLGQTELPYRGVTFTNASKNEMMVKLMLSFEAASFLIPQIASVIYELKVIEVNTTMTGLPTYSAPSGANDDIVMSIALAHTAMIEHSDRDYGIIEF